MKADSLLTDEYKEAHVDALYKQVLLYCTEKFGQVKARGVMDAVLGITSKPDRFDYLRDLFMAVSSNTPESYAPLFSRSSFAFKPVDVETFLLNPYYMDLGGQVYPEVLKEMAEINSGKYVETVLTGGIGSAKTTCALWTTAYQLYLLSALKNPQGEFGLDRSSEILFVFQTLSADKAKKLDFARFKHLMENSPYFNEKFPFQRGLESELRFPNRIIVRPVSGAQTATIGENVFGGLLDEVNFMAVVENSKSSIDGGTYDQAQALYNSIATRRKSRFMKGGKVYGMLCLVSSKRYPGQFTDRKEAEAKIQIAETGKSNIYIYDKRTWEIKPEGSFCGEWFHVFAGDASRKPRVLSEEELADFGEEDAHLICRIPVEHRWEFENDIITALRDVAGVSTLATTPYFPDTESVAAGFGVTSNLFTTDYADFVKTKATMDLSRIANKLLPRAAHIDLSKTGDSTGLVIGHVAGFKQLLRGDEVEILPEITIDGVLEIKPPRGGEILYWKIREILYALRDAGLNIKWVTCDSYQSTDNLQILKQKGFVTGEISMDTSIRPYALVKSAFTDRRIYCPKHDLLQMELVSLEFDAKKGKVDHPDVGVCSSKDVADALAGVVTCLTTRREIWAHYKVPLVRLPPSITELESLARMKDDDQAKKKNTTTLA